MPAIDDAVDEPLETVTITYAVSSNDADYNNFSLTSRDVHVTDNDDPLSGAIEKTAILSGSTIFYTLS